MGGISKGLELGIKWFKFKMNFIILR